MDRIYVKPAPGVKVRHPETLQHLPAEGQLVTADSYWTRRIADGDVVVTEAPASDADHQE